MEGSVILLVCCRTRSIDLLPLLLNCQFGLGLLGVEFWNSDFFIDCLEAWIQFLFNSELQQARVFLEHVPYEQGKLLLPEQGMVSGSELDPSPFYLLLVMLGLQLSHFNIVKALGLLFSFFLHFFKLGFSSRWSHFG